jgi:hypothetical protein
MANRGENLRGLKEGKDCLNSRMAQPLRHRCRSQSHRAQYARIQIKCGDRIGQPLWKRDYCETHALSVLKRAEKRGIVVSWL